MHRSAILQGCANLYENSKLQRLSLRFLCVYNALGFFIFISYQIKLRLFTKACMPDSLIYSLSQHCFFQTMIHFWGVLHLALLSTWIFPTTQYNLQKHASLCQRFFQRIILKWWVHGMTHIHVFNLILIDVKKKWVNLP